MNRRAVNGELLLELFALHSPCTIFASKNDFVKPKDQRELARFGLARNRTFKNVFVKREQRKLACSAERRKGRMKSKDLCSEQPDDPTK